MNRPLRHSLLCLPALGLIACAHQDRRPPQVEEVVHQANERDAAQVHLDLVRNMIDKEQYYAALAHLEQIESSGEELSPEVRYLKAEALRKMGRLQEAEAVYRSLEGTPLAGQAEHGLGLLLARTDVNSALGHLERAVKADPTNADYRNDLGYSYMLLGRFDLARAQFSTAMQLKKDARSTNNLIVLLLIEGREEDAAALAARAQISDADWRSLKQQAQNWSIGSAAAGASG